MYSSETFLRILTILAIIHGLVSARMARRYPFSKQDELPTEDDIDICHPLGEGNFTLTVVSTLIAVPTFDGDNPWAEEASGNASQAILESACKYLPIKDDVETRGNGHGFDGNLTVHGWVKPVKFYADSIGPGFTSGVEFCIKDRTYTDCQCKDYASGLEARTSCRCEFKYNTILQ